MFHFVALPKKFIVVDLYTVDTHNDISIHFYFIIVPARMEECPVSTTEYLQK